MILLRLNTIIFASTLWALQPRAEQSPMLIQESQVSQVSQSGSKVGADPKRVAIIGAGAAGASAAYFLHELARIALPLDIDIYERSSRVGGRVKSANVYGKQLKHTETGAASFSDEDWCLSRAMKEVGLQEQYKNPLFKELGVWNGKDFVFTQPKDSSHWWNLAKLTWKYGLSALRMENLVEQTAKGFHRLAETRPFVSLADETERIGLKASTEQDAELFLQRNNIASLFMTDIIQANTRARYTQDLKSLHGLASIMSMAPEGAKSVDGGNWRLFDRMIRISKAQLRLNSQVVKLDRNQDGSFSLGYKSTKSSANSSLYEYADYDDVIIAAPFQFTDIEIEPPLQNQPLDIPYVERHVTHFTSPHKLTPEAFALSPNETVPEDVLTTLRFGDDPGFFSITLSEEVTYSGKRQCVGELEYLYKLVSARPIDDSTIAHLLGLPYVEGSSLAESSVRWIDRQAWPYAFPLLPARATFDDIELAENLYYTGGGENLVSSMEMSSLMGYNVASVLYWQKWFPDDPEP